MDIPKSARKPPGRKIIKRLSTRTKWALLTLGGLLLTMYGLTTLVHAGIWQQTGVDPAKWVLLGIYSFGVISAGILLLGQAFRFRTIIDIRRETRRNLRQLEKKIDTKRLRGKSQQRRKSRAKTKNPTKMD